MDAARLNIASGLLRKRVVLALTVGLFFYALSDILLWQRIFEAHDLFQFDYQYQSGHVATLVAMIAIGMILLLDAGWWALWYGAAFYTLCFSGLEDALYYLLQGKPIPEQLPWLDTYHSPLLLFNEHVTRTSLVESTVFWISWWAVSLWLLPRVVAAARGAATDRWPRLRLALRRRR